jgi:hypothetical protein
MISFVLMGVGTSVSGTKSPSRLWLTGAKSLDRICKRLLLEWPALTAAIQAAQLLRVNDSQATLHIKSPNQTGPGLSRVC